MNKRIVIRKNSTRNDRISKKRLKAKIKRGKRKYDENRRKNGENRKHNRYSRDIETFLKLNKSKHKKRPKWFRSKHSIVLDSTFNLHEGSNKVLISLYQLVKDAQSGQSEYLLKYDSGRNFGALYLIDAFCWEISKSQNWRLRTKDLPQDIREVFAGLKSLESGSREVAYAFMTNSRLLLSRDDQNTTFQEHKKESKKVRELVERAIAECTHDYEFELSELEHKLIDASISELFDNILLHVPEAKVGYLFSMYDKQTEEVIIMVYNFGRTIAESMEDSEFPEDVGKFIGDVMNKHGCGNTRYSRQANLITQENTLTLLAIQEGISTKLIEDRTRGHGLIDYIKYCFDLNPETRITIVSGNTSIALDKRFPMHKQDYLGRSRKTISLNTSEDIMVSPSRDVVINNSIRFPGVIIQTTIPLKKSIK